MNEENINNQQQPVSAYCQTCGRPLRSEEVRQVGGVVYCEPCLAARLNGGPAPAGAYPGAVPPAAWSNLGGSVPRPGLAALFGFIPGVGAMYNGQFLKALAHVIVFAVLVSLADDHGIFGTFVAAWVLYQVFDAFKTAEARRDGLPLPDPFGLNDLGSRIGITPQPPVGRAPGVPPAAAPFGNPGVYPPVDPAASGAVPFTPVYDPAAPVPPPPGLSSSTQPVGAIVLIALGVLFLLNSLNIFHWHWSGSWPLILIGIGVWLMISRLRSANGGIR